MSTHFNLSPFLKNYTSKDSNNYKSRLHTQVPKISVVHITVAEVAAYFAGYKTAWQLIHIYCTSF